LARRLHLYNTLAESRHDMLVQSLLVLLRRQADSPQLTGLSTSGFPGEEPYRTFRYKVVKLWQEPVERLLTGGLGMVALAPLSDEAAPQLDAVLRQMEERFRTEVEPAEANNLWTASGILMGLRYDRAVIAALIQRVRGMRESSTYQLILEEGMTEGRAQGAIAEERRTLLDLGEIRFGAPPPEITAALQAMTDLARLHQLQRRLLQCSSWAELLAAPEDGSAAR
jgi:predicted transposase YdaD